MLRQGLVPPQRQPALAVRALQWQEDQIAAQRKALLQQVRRRAPRDGTPRPCPVQKSKKRPWRRWQQRAPPRGPAPARSSSPQEKDSRRADPNTSPATPVGLLAAVARRQQEAQQAAPTLPPLLPPPQEKAVGRFGRRTALPATPSPRAAPPPPALGKAASAPNTPRRKSGAPAASEAAATTTPRSLRKQQSQPGTASEPATPRRGPLTPAQRQARLQALAEQQYAASARRHLLLATVATLLQVHLARDLVLICP
jgi:hypothetical protein